DATGLGRIHRFSLPSELGLSCPIVPHPNYLVSVKSSPRSIAIGPGWEDNKGNKYWLADFTDEIEKVTVKDVKEKVEEIQFKVTYTGKFENCNSVTEFYRLNTSGLEIEDRILASARAIMVQIPLLKTDGLNSSRVELGKGWFKVKYMNYLYKVECLEPKMADTFLEPFSVPNRNGIYQVGCFRTRGSYIKYRISLLGISSTG
ncbi:unnamed protein product, partial [marine sediment metagenome]